MNRTIAIERAITISDQVGRNALDPLLACVEIAALLKWLPKLPTTVADTFSAVASELDGVPLSPEDAARWPADYVTAQNLKNARYRESISPVVKAACQELSSFLRSQANGH